MILFLNGSLYSNLVLTSDSDFSQIFTLENAETNSPTNLTGFTIASSIRKHPAAKKERVLTHKSLMQLEEK